jgi:hypothetical protein
MKWLLFILLPAVASAHHSLLAEFDPDRTITLTGTIARIEWMNPHAWIHVQTKDGVWDIEVGSPSDLVRRGWSRSDLKPGEAVTIEGILAKKLPRTANARSITLGNGKRVFNGRAELVERP